jgi:hypothetical protein
MKKSRVLKIDRIVASIMALDHCSATEHVAVYMMNGAL